MTWVYEQIRLSFRIGNRTLGQSRLMGINCHEHISRLDVRSSLEPPLESLRSHRATLARLPTCPTDRKLPVLSRVGQGYYRYVVKQFPHFLTTTAIDFDHWLSTTLSRNARKKYRRILRRWRAYCGGELHWREYRGLEQIETFLPLARSVSAKTMQHRVLKRGLTEGGRREALILETAARNMARGYLLFDGDKPVAFNYGYLSPGKVLTLEYGGYDPAYRKWSVGSLLDFLVIEAIHQDPEIDMLDFGEGEGEYKQRFANMRIDAAHVLFFKPTPRNLALVGGHLAISRLSLGLRALLIRFNLLERAKLLVRPSVPHDIPIV